MIYLVNPSEHRILENAGDRIPIGLLSMATQFNKQGEKTKIFDLNHMTNKDFLRSFQAEKPKITGISVYTSPIAREARGLAKVLKGSTKLVAGGHHATAMPESLPEFDLVIQGEGENALELMTGAEGITRMKSPNLDNLPDLDYGLLNMDNYQMQQSGKRVGTLITSRGCPYHCSFCGKLSDKVRHEPVGKVIAEADNLKRQGFKSLYFLDDVFTLNKQRMKAIVENLNVPYRVTTRANLVDGEKLEILAETGCEWLSMGIESGNNEILKRSNKEMTIDDNEEAIYLAGQYGIDVKGFFIIGLPGETEKTAKETIDFSLGLRDLGLSQAEFYFLTPFPGTPIWNNPKKFGIEITNKDYTCYLEAGKDAHCYVNTKHLSAPRIEQLVKEAKEQWK